MKLLKRSPVSQSTLELIVMTVLIMAAIAVMGPYVVRSINAYMRSWERQATEGEIDVDISSLPWFDQTGPILTCENVNCANLGYAECTGDMAPEGCEVTELIKLCCIWVLRFEDQPGQACGQVSTGCIARAELCEGPEGVGYCCGGPEGLSPPPGGGAHTTWCDDKWNCHPWDCSSCDDGECNYQCRDVGFGSPEDEEGEPCDCPDCMLQVVGSHLNPYYTGQTTCSCFYDPDTGTNDGCEHCPPCDCGDGYCRWTEREGGPGPSCEEDCVCGICSGQWTPDIPDWQWEQGSCNIDFEWVTAYCNATEGQPCCGPVYGTGCNQTTWCANYDGLPDQCNSTTPVEGGDGQSYAPSDWCLYELWDPPDPQPCNQFDDQEALCKSKDECTWYPQPCGEPEPPPDCAHTHSTTCWADEACAWVSYIQCSATGSGDPCMGCDSCDASYYDCQPLTSNPCTSFHPGSPTDEPCCNHVSAPGGQLCKNECMCI